MLAELTATIRLLKDKRQEITDAIEVLERIVIHQEPKAPTALANPPIRRVGRKRKEPGETRRYLASQGDICRAMRKIGGPAEPAKIREMLEEQYNIRVTEAALEKQLQHGHGTYFKNDNGKWWMFGTELDREPNSLEE